MDLPTWLRLPGTPSKPQAGGEGSTPDALTTPQSTVRSEEVDWNRRFQEMEAHYSAKLALLEKQAAERERQLKMDFEAEKERLDDRYKNFIGKLRETLEQKNVLETKVKLTGATGASLAWRTGAPFRTISSAI